MHNMEMWRIATKPGETTKLIHYIRQVTQGRQETSLLTFSTRETGRPVGHTPANIFIKSNATKLKLRKNALLVTSWMRCTCMLHSLLNQIFNDLAMSTIIHILLYQFGKSCEQNFPNFTASWAQDIIKVDFIEVLQCLISVCASLKMY